MDLLASLRHCDDLTRGLTDDELLLLKKLARENPNAKFIIPTPGTESKLNGLTVDDVSSVVRTYADGSNPTKRELVEKLGGNPKSGRDTGKVDKIIKSGDIRELVYEKPTRAKLTVQLLEHQPADTTDE